MFKELEGKACYGQENLRFYLSDITKEILSAFFCFENSAERCVRNLYDGISWKNVQQRHSRENNTFSVCVENVPTNVP